MLPPKEPMEPRVNPSVFIGSSTKGLEIARAIMFQLQHDAEVTIWNEGVFRPGEFTLEALANALDRFDFAILVLTPDDLVLNRESPTYAPHGNVMFELGLFMGRLGRARTYVVSDRGVEIPCDLAGVTLATFDSARPDGNLRAAVGPCCAPIREAIRDLGFSDAKTGRQVQRQVESIGQTVAQLVNLLARSRIVELEVVARQFGFLLPRDLLDRICSDLRDLVAATQAEQRQVE